MQYVLIDEYVYRTGRERQSDQIYTLSGISGFLTGIAVHLLMNLAETETTVEHQCRSTAEIKRLSEW